LLLLACLLLLPEPRRSRLRPMSMVSPKILSRRLGLALVLNTLLAVAALPAWAQLAPAPDAPPAASAIIQTIDTTPVPTPLVVDVNLVSLYFTVKDKNGLLLPHLTEQDCRVREEGRMQTIKRFAAESNQPLTLGVLLDTSGSQQRMLADEQKTGGRFLSRLLRPTDQAFLLSFDVNVDLLQDLTNEPALLIHAMEHAQINTAGGSAAGSGPVPMHGRSKGTLLYDALAHASAEKLAHETGRKTILLLTDGKDEGSRSSLGDAIAAAQRADAMVYVILIADHTFADEFERSGQSAMKRLTEETGGRMINVGGNNQKLELAFKQIEDELRTQYVASYTPTEVEPGGGLRSVAFRSGAFRSGAFRSIALECGGEGRRVQVRRGYYPSAMPQ